MRRLFEGDTYSSLITVIGNLRVYYIYCKLLLRLGQNVITFRTFITFRPSTTLALDFPFTVYLPAIFPGNFSRWEEKFPQCSSGRQTNILPGTNLLHINGA